MKLWGIVGRAFMLVAAAVFLAVAYGMPEARWQAAAAASVFIAAALFGIPALVRLFSSITGDEELLANGLPYSATVTALEPTRWRYNRYYPIVKFSLNVQAGGGAYPVEIKQAVDPEFLRRLAAGTVVDVRVDRTNPKNVVISWRDVVRNPGDPATAAAGTETRPAFNRFVSRTNAATVGAILVVVSVFFAAIAFEEWRYEQHGVTVQGTALGINGKGKWVYKFAVDGRALEGESEVLSDTASKLKEGGPVGVQYLSGAPETNRIPGQRASYATWRNLTVVALVAGMALLIRSRRRRARRNISRLLLMAALTASATTQVRGIASAAEQPPIKPGAKAVASGLPDRTPDTPPPARKYDNREYLGKSAAG